MGPSLCLLCACSALARCLLGARLPLAWCSLYARSMLSVFEGTWDLPGHIFMESSKRYPISYVLIYCPTLTMSHNWLIYLTKTSYDSLWAALKICLMKQLLPLMVKLLQSVMKSCLDLEQGYYYKYTIMTIKTLVQFPIFPRTLPTYSNSSIFTSVFNIFKEIT